MRSVISRCRLPAAPRTGRRWLPRGRSAPTPSPVLALQADALELDAEDVGQPLADGLAMGEQLGPLGEDDAVDVDDLPAERGDGVASAAASISAESRPRLAGSVSGNIWPMSPRAAAPAGRRSRRAAARRRRCGRPTPDRGECRSPPSRSGPPGRSRWVSCPIPTRGARVIVSPVPVFLYRRNRAGLYLPGARPTTRSEDAMGDEGAGTDFGGLEAGWELGWRI